MGRSLPKMAIFGKNKYTAPMNKITTKSRQQLKAKAHGLKPVVLLGNQGLTEAVKKEIDRALTDHQLIKIRVSIADRDAKKSIVDDICTSLKAEKIQVIGHIAVLFRKSAD
jgi:RNA-binding protein